LGKSLVKKPSFFLSGLSLKISLYLLFSRYGCLPSLHLVAGERQRFGGWVGQEVKPWLQANVQKRDCGKMTGEGDGAAHWAANQLLALAALVLAAALVGLNERLTDAEGGGGGEGARQLLGAGHFGWAFVQLGHVAMLLENYWTERAKFCGLLHSERSKLFDLRGYTRAGTMMLAAPACGDNAAACSS
jgi:hypothetical protein